MANKKQTRRGTIQKVVHVELRNDQSAAALPAEENRRGYGLVRGEDGQEVFFIDSVVRDTKFEDLRTGQAVDFQIEDGPLMRAECVRIPSDPAPTADERELER